MDAANKGANDTFIGHVAFLDEPPVHCYVKFLDDRQLVNELVCSQLARTVGLRVPRGFLATVERADYPTARMFAGNAETHRSAFAVESLAHPSLLRRIRLEGDQWRYRLKEKWSGWTAAASFDEWVANGDRHEGNLLVGEPDDVWLIDHSHALTGPAWTVESLRACGYTPYPQNRLAGAIGQLLQPPEVGAEVLRATEIETLAQAVSLTDALESSFARCFLSSKTPWRFMTSCNCGPAILPKTCAITWVP